MKIAARKLGRLLQAQIMDFTLQGPVAGPDPWKSRMDLAQRFSERRASGN